MDVLQRILDLRRQRGWSEYELAKRADVPQSTISSWYKKQMYPSVPNLMKICRGFDITVSQFFLDEAGAIDLTENQRRFLDKYNALSDNQKEKLDLFLDGMLID